MTRVLQPELLDELPSTDPRAVHSRRDLRRINSLMGNVRAITGFVSRYVETKSLKSPVSIVEIGAGEGYIAISLARELSKRNLSGNIFLVDRQPLQAEAINRWNISRVNADIFDWLASAEKKDIIVANLFLHHFEGDQLNELLRRCASLCDCFVAAEPRRSRCAEWFAGRVQWIGCNEVTLHDAEISVRAGFHGNELSEIWPKDATWSLVERRAGLFTHFFAATRRP